MSKFENYKKINKLNNNENPIPSAIMTLDCQPTMPEIAKELGITKKKCSKLIEEAMQNGLIKFYDHVTCEVTKQIIDAYEIIERRIN